MSVFITGISGFIGTYLAQYFLDQGEAVAGYDRVFPDNPEIHFYEGDIGNLAELKKALQDSMPRIVFHLAGILKASQFEAFEQINILGTKTLLDAIKDLSVRPVFLLASSSAIYGRGYGGRLITERFKPRPETPYAVSKLDAEQMARTYFKSYGIPVIIARVFNLIGPRQPPSLACSTFARQIALAEKSGPEGTVEAGNLEASRDYSDVRDVVRAYALLARLGRPGSVYNICSGKAVSTWECLDTLVKMARVPLKTEVYQNRYQTNDIPFQVGSAERLRRVTGWQPLVSFQQSLADLLEYWRKEVA